APSIAPYRDTTVEGALARSCPTLRCAQRPCSLGRICTWHSMGARGLTLCHLQGPRRRGGKIILGDLRRTQSKIQRLKNILRDLKKPNPKNLIPRHLEHPVS